jgi:16S rRNA processing protein RimM
LEGFFEIGVVVKPQGLRGRVKLKSYLVTPEDTLTKVDRVLLRGSGQDLRSLEIKAWQVRGQSLFLDLEGIETVEGAASLVGQRVWVSREHLRILPEGEYYWEDLIGMTVETEDGSPLGVLQAIFPTGSNDVYVCEGTRGEILLPAIEDVILNVDVEQRRMTVRVMPGLVTP